MKNFFENFKEYIHLVDDEGLKQLLSGVSVAEILDYWDWFEIEERMKIFLLLDLEKKVDLLNSLSNVEQERILETLPLDNLRLLFEEMEPDDITDVIQSVSPEVRKNVWETLSDEARQETQFLLRFDEDDAAGLMTPRYAAIRGAIRVGHAINFLRKGIKDIETIYYIYVVDQLKRLQGVVSLKELLSSEDDVLVSEIMSHDIITVREDTDQEEVARTLEDWSLIAVPVVDKFQRLLGIVTFDDIIDVIRDEHTEDVYKMGAMSGSTERYMDTGIWRLVKKRIPWLTILLLAGTLTTNVIDFYSPMVLQAAFLSLFIPVITQTGGNSGTQSSTLMIRGLATGELRFKDLGRVVLKELIVGLIIGLLMSLVIISRSVVLPPGVEFFNALAIGFSLVFVILFSTMIGAMAPLIISKLGGDPAVMAAPLMATVIDVIGLTIYFEISKLFLGL